MSSPTSGVPRQSPGLVARFIAAFMGRIRKLIRKKAAEDPKIYPFF